MSFKRPRRYGPVLLVAVALLALAACGEQYPNSTFNPTTDLNIAIKALWDRLLFFGTIVFVFVEALLIFTIIKFRKREGSPEPKQVHGNAALEITWTGTHNGTFTGPAAGSISASADASYFTIASMRVVSPARDGSR